MLRTVELLCLFAFVKVVVCTDFSWDFFVYSQQWAPSVCVDIASEHKCVIPKNVTGWTIHGLWPNKDGSSEDPHDCNSSYPFNWQEIETLKSKLIAQWPNTYADTPFDDFWKHEWEKHGTCSTNLLATKNEFDYFNQGLKLNTNIDLVGVLNKHGFPPSNVTGYNITKIIDSVKSFYGTKPKVSCTYDKQTKQQLILQLELCMDKKFNFAVCDTKHKKQYRAEGCRVDELVFILPLPEKQYQFINALGL